MLGNDRSAAIAALIITFRRMRCEILSGNLFSEPAWDLLLALYVADAEGKRITARTVSDRFGIAHSVMARWLIRLVSIIFVVGEGNGDLDDALSLSGNALEHMERLMASASPLHQSLV